MTVKQLAEKFTKLAETMPDTEVLFQDPDAHGGPVAVGRLTERVSEGEFPKNFQMPKGFKYVLIEC